MSSDTRPRDPGPWSWHLDPVDLRDYVGGASAPADTVSAEAHLIGCGTCRSALSALVEPRPLQQVWQAVVDEVSTPAPSRVERLATRLGLSERDSLLVAAAPALRGAWVLGLLTSLLVAVLAASDDGARASLLFLAVAPLLPVGAVALAYGRELDPLWETALVAPYPRLRLVLLRALAVVLSALPLAIVASPMLSAPGWVAAAWLLPAAACVAVALALSTWFDATRASGGVATAWLVLVGVLAGPGLHEPLLVLAEPLLVSYAVVAVLAFVVFWRHCDTYATIGRST